MPALIADVESLKGWAPARARTAPCSMPRTTEAREFPPGPCLVIER